MWPPPSVWIGVAEKPGSLVSTIRIEMPLCLSAAGSVRHGEPDVVGAVGAAGEDLGAVHHEDVAFAHGARLERGEVGARAGLGVADREVDLAAQDSRQEALLLRLAAARDQGGADGVERDEGQRRAGAPGLLEPDLLLDRRAPLAPPLLRPAHAEPAVGAHLPDQPALERARLERADLRAHVGRDQLREVGAELCAKRLLGGGVVDVHAGPRESESIGERAGESRPRGRPEARLGPGADWGQPAGA